MIAKFSTDYSARKRNSRYTKIVFYIIILPTCRGAISLAEMKPVEPEEAKTFVGNKRVLKSSLNSKMIITHYLVRISATIHLSPLLFIKLGEFLCLSKLRM